MSNFDILIAGAGIVGLATAYQLLEQKPGLRVLVLEKEQGPALHQTGRNSGVVHSGIYYKPGSLKAKNCIEGRKELLAFCESQGIRYEKKHKLIVATEKEELSRLETIHARGRANGIPGLRLLSKQEVLEIEPNVNAMIALFLPECFILDYTEIARALCREIEKRGGTIVFNEPVLKVQGAVVTGKKKTYQCRFFINCTGVYSDRMVRASQEKMDLRILPFRGEYYELVKKNCIQGLIYPVPDPKFPFLGVHLTPRLNGSVEAGPNAVLALSREGYRKSDIRWQDVREIFLYRGFWKMASRHWKTGIYEIARSWSKQLFTRDLQRLVPSLKEEDLRIAGSGIRAQVVTKEGTLLDDFVFVQKEYSLHVVNAPSPAATASFAIGRTLAQIALCTL